jgi:hypothetical protein
VPWAEGTGSKDSEAKTNKIKKQELATVDEPGKGGKKGRM